MIFDAVFEGARRRRKAKKFDDDRQRRTDGAFIVDYKKLVESREGGTSLSTGEREQLVMAQGKKLFPLMDTMPAPSTIAR